MINFVFEVYSLLVLIYADYIHIGCNQPSCERIDIIQMIIGLTFIMKHTGSRSCNLSNSRKCFHDPSDWNIDLFEFLDCSMLATFLV